MNIALYENNSPENMVDKLLTNQLWVIGDFTRDVDLTLPIIRITGDTPLLDYNYAFIPDLGRKYFIREFNIYRKGVTDISLEIDVLSSFATDLRECNAFVRFGANSNPYQQGFITGVDVRRDERKFSFNNPFTNGSFILVGIRGERKAVTS